MLVCGFSDTQGSRTETCACSCLTSRIGAEGVFAWTDAYTGIERKYRKLRGVLHTYVARGRNNRLITGRTYRENSFTVEWPALLPASHPLLAWAGGMDSPSLHRSATSSPRPAVVRRRPTAGSPQDRIPSRCRGWRRGRRSGSHRSVRPTPAARAGPMPPRWPPTPGRRTVPAGRGSGPADREGVDVGGGNRRHVWLEVRVKKEGRATVVMAP